MERAEARVRFRRTVSRRLRNEGIADGFWHGAIPGTKARGAREIAADGRVNEGSGLRAVLLLLLSVDSY